MKGKRVPSTVKGAGSEVKDGRLDSFGGFVSAGTTYSSVSGMSGSFPAISSKAFEEMFPRDVLSDQDRHKLQGRTLSVIVSEAPDGSRMLGVPVPDDLDVFEDIQLTSNVFHSEVGLVTGRATEAVATRRWMRAHLGISAALYASLVLCGGGLLALVLVALFGWVWGLVLGGLVILWAAGLFPWLVFMVWRQPTGWVAWVMLTYAAPIALLVAGVVGPPMWDGTGGTPGDWWRRALRRTHVPVAKQTVDSDEESDSRIVTEDDFLDD